MGIPIRTTFGMTDYTAAKAGLLGFTRSLANEVAHHNITVNAVHPGVTRTALAASFDEEHQRRTLASIPVGRLADPEEIAHAVAFFASPGAFFASPGASYVTGEHLLVTGGRTMH